MKKIVFGFILKENTPDARNTKEVNVINGLEEYEIKVQVVDP